MDGEDKMGMTTAEAPEEISLFGVIRELNELSWKLTDLVYGTQPKEQTEKQDKVVKDKITDARNRISESNGRIIEAIKRLEGIGK